MQLLSLCLLAIVFAATAANAGKPSIKLIYGAPGKRTVVKQASYGDCIAIDRPGDQHLKLIIYPSQSSCQHYKDAKCTQKSSFPPNVHRPGVNVPVRNYGFGKCHPI